METVGPKDLEESFSFSCHELNSALEFLPLSDDDESYIEIDIESPPDSTEFEFPIPFSSLEFSDQIRPNDLFGPDYKMTGPHPNPETGISYGDRSSPSARPGISTVGISEAKFRVVQDEVKEAKLVNDRSRKNRQFVRRLRKRDRVGSRKPSKIVTAVNNGVLKFFIKLRSGNIVSTFMSLIKSYYTFSLRSNGGDDTKRSRVYRRLIKPFTTWWAHLDNTSTDSSSISSSNNNNSNNKKVVDGENLLHAAIDYCKRSPADTVDSC